MKNLDLREKYYYNLKNALIYPLKNSDGMLNLASMQRVFIKDSVFCYFRHTISSFGILLPRKGRAFRVGCKLIVSKNKSL